MPTGISPDSLTIQPWNNSYAHSAPLKPTVKLTSISDDILKFSHTKINPLTEKIPLLGKMERFFKGVNQNLLNSAEKYAAQSTAPKTFGDKLAGGATKSYAWIRTHNPFYELKNLFIKKGYITSAAVPIAESSATAGAALSKSPALSKFGKMLTDSKKIPVIGNVLVGAFDVAKGIVNAVKSLAKGEITNAFKHLAGGIVKGGIQVGTGVLLSTPVARLGSLAGFMLGTAGTLGAEWLGNRVNDFLGLTVKNNTQNKSLDPNIQQQLQQMQGQLPQQQMINPSLINQSGNDNPFLNNYGLPTYGLPAQMTQYGYPQNTAFNSLSNLGNPYYNQLNNSIPNIQYPNSPIPNPHGALRDAFQTLQSVERSYFGDTPSF